MVELSDFTGTGVLQENYIGLGQFGGTQRLGGSNPIKPSSLRGYCDTEKEVLIL